MEFPSLSSNSVLKNRYVIHEKIGEGATAEVYRATHLLLDREVAIKIIKANLSQKSTAQRFIQEARAVARLNHPNILQVYDFDTIDDYRSFMATEYLPEGDLFSMLHRRQIIGQPFTLPDSISIVKSVAQGLHYAHQQGVIHRDLKPSNIFFSGDQRVVVGDFGLAKLAEPAQALTMEESVMGTPAYISPERIMGLPVDARTDIYALGIVFFHLLTGEMPYQGEPMEILAQHLHAPVPDVGARCPELPSMVSGIIQRALAKNPDNRYPTMAALITSLDLLSKQIDTSDRTLIIEMPTPSSLSFSRVPAPPFYKRLPPLRVWMGVLLLVVGMLVGGTLAGLVKLPGTSDSRSPDVAAHIEPAASDEILVIVASMAGADPRVDLTQAVADELKTGVVGIVLAGRLRVAVLEDPIDSKEQAAAIGQQTNAALVIWGEQFTVGCEAVVQAPRHPDGAIQKLGLLALYQDGPAEVCIQQVPTLIDYYARFLLLSELILADDMDAVFYLALSFREMDDALVRYAQNPLDRQVLEIFTRINQQQYLEADTVATEILNIAPDDIGLYFMRWAANALSGQLSLVEQDVLRLQALTPGRDFGTALLVVTYFLFGEGDKLVEVAQPLLDSSTSAAVMTTNQYLLVRIHQGYYQQVFDYILPVQPGPASPERAVTDYLVSLTFLREIQGDASALEALLPEFLDLRQDRLYQEGFQFFRQFQPRYYHPVAFSQGGYGEEISGQTVMASLTYQLALSLHPNDYLVLWRQAVIDTAAGNVQRAYERYDAAVQNAPAPFPIARYEQARLVLDHAADLDSPRSACALADEAQTLAETDTLFYAVLLTRIDALREAAACPGP